MVALDATIHAFHRRSRMTTIRIACALIQRADGATLLVRKRGTTAFMQPGGKVEPHEQSLDALIRELQEELCVTVRPSDPTYLGRFTAQAANEPGLLVDADLYQLNITSDVVPAAEIDEITWLKPGHKTHLTLAPLTRDHVLPIVGWGAPSHPTDERPA